MPRPAITFVGPSPEALALFGDKVRARAAGPVARHPRRAGHAGAPSATADEAAKAASEIGYPVMLKAAAGGGGRGMRAVHGPGDVAEAFERCRSEATMAFGDGAVFIERLVERPRHIEVQILADAHGNVVHLHDRDCSVQIRNQKVVEIAPAPGLDAALRERILGSAVELARASGYVNAGTVEFLVVPERGEYFFIECNPRIQVEHTVTEQVTGVDLVGRAVPHRRRGHARRARPRRPGRRRRPARVTRCRPASSPRAPVRSPRTRSRRGRACASTPVATPGTRRRRSSTRCWRR